ncbi:uncharacterized protein LOC106778966 [Vigna radiata var. radiata]|uniref:Uncharacterized protein LOC106778966 n=1 Tax=Vigna radiata var. radiata TaxID=3916 RepID=A0A1S3VWA2_VIGRR|nr:uncharacterized protein LOC106778966 [Vigna radiata var. radiata]
MNSSTSSFSLLSRVVLTTTRLGARRGTETGLDAWVKAYAKQVKANVSSCKFLMEKRYGRTTSLTFINKHKCTIEFGIYEKAPGQRGMLLIWLYVDDLIITGDSVDEIEKFKKRMKEEYEMTDLGSLSYFLGMEFLQNEDGIYGKSEISSQTDEEKVDATLYKQIIGSLRYICNSRPDISYGVVLLSRFINDPRQSHLATAKHILRYLKGTAGFGLFFPKKSDSIKEALEVWCDFDWCGDKVDRRSTFGYLFKYLGATVSWCSRKQGVVVLSSCEAEYISAVEMAC